MKNYTIVLMVLVAAASRLIPHAPNVTAVTAMALLGGAYLSNRTWAAIVPVLALLLSDLIIGFHSTMLFVYAAVALIAVGSSLVLQSNVKKSTVLASSLVASLFFFVVTNLGVWMMDSMYPKTLAGLGQCYVMAIPFFGTQAFGDLMYTVLLFGAVQVLKAWKPELLATRA